jgi:hypothetical protein
LLISDFSKNTGFEKSIWIAFESHHESSFSSFSIESIRLCALTDVPIELSIRESILDKNQVSRMAKSMTDIIRPTFVAIRM